MTTYLLHGFWGQPKDWNEVVGRLPLGLSLQIPDLYEPGPLAPGRPLADWVREFWQRIDALHPAADIQIVGYSMGGRLALNAVMHRPSRVRRALFLSTHPGLELSAQAAREQWEREWARKFLHIPWEQLEREWQELAVFHGAPALSRRKTPEMREMLGLSLCGWSSARHIFAPLDLRALPNGMDWAFGALDQKYLEVAKNLQELPVQGQISIIPRASHRLVVEGAAFISRWIENLN